VNTAEYITTLVADKAVILAAIGAAYGIVRPVAGRLQVAAPKAPPTPPQQQKPDDGAAAGPKQEPAAGLAITVDPDARKSA
jgi:hypothetical protein